MINKIIDKNVKLEDEIENEENAVGNLIDNAKLKKRIERKSNKR